MKSKIMFNIIRLIKKLNLNEDIKELIQKMNSDKKIQINENELGVKLINKIIDNFENIENEYYKLVASFKNINEKEAENIDMFNFIKELIEDFKKNGVLNDFFIKLSSLNKNNI